MSQRDSGYERRQLDLYETPVWVTRALVPHLPATLAWLVARYRETIDWNQDLSSATRRQRENIFSHVLATAGAVPVGQITPAAIREPRKTIKHACPGSELP